MTEPNLLELARNYGDEIVALARRLIQTPSYSGQEGALARIVEEALRAAGCDEVWVDEAGNVQARNAGGGGSSTMLHAHMDIVDPGDETAWRYPPFAAQVADGAIWGRGASDDKGCLTAQIAAMTLLRRHDLQPVGDVYLAAVVNEEIGGLGSRHLARTLRPDVAIIGEPSANTIRRGHRGRFEFVVSLHGRSAHASAPERGRNPHYSMARFLLALREAPMMRHDLFGGSTVVPTLLYVDQTSSNVIPAQIIVHLDWRAVPGETMQDARALLRRLLDDTVEEDIRAEITLYARTGRTYTGYEEELAHELAPFCLEEDAPILRRAHRSLENAMGRPVSVGVWTFCTDGGHLYQAGVPCVGFGPGEETMAHVLDERIAIEQIVEATAGYLGLALHMGETSE